MLKLPAYLHKQFPDGSTATVFQDDAQFWKFYVVPGFPVVRTDPNGNPVFQLIKFNFSDQSREEDPDLARGGGYMVFDSELKVSDEQLEELTDDLTPHVQKEFERLKAMANAPVRQLTMKAMLNDSISQHWKDRGTMVGSPAVPANRQMETTIDMPQPDMPDVPVECPPVIFGEPLWVEGKVSMNAPSAPGLVSGKIGERPASMVGNNVAAFSLDLTPDGAIFMEQTLVGRDGGGATDLTPIQVVYELTMLAKLPPARMYVKFQTQSVYSAVQELFHEHHNCTDDYFTSESMMSTAIEAGLITIKIDAGGMEDPKMIQLLQQQATAMVQQLLAERFASKERAPLEEWANDDINGSSAEVYRLKQVSEVDMTDFEQVVTIEPTTRFKMAPQGTLQAFFKSQRDMSPFVRTIDTNQDTFFRTLGLKARAFANWEADDVAFVELEMKYEHGDSPKVQTFTFTPADKDPKEWDPALVDGKRDYEYRWRVGFEGRAAGEWSRWEKTTTRNLNVSVETPGKLAVEVSGVGLDFENVLDAVLVHLRYGDTARDVPMAAQSILLAKDRPAGSWSRQLYAPWDKPLEYRIEYLLKSGTTIEKPWSRTDGPSQNLLVTRPNVDVLDLTLIPAGRWTDVIQAVLSMRYVDGSYSRDAQFNFTKPDEFKKWAVLLLNARQRKFEYKVLATFKNGDTQETAWLSREGDQALPVMVEGPPRLEVKVTGAVLDYASTPLAKIDLEYSDPQGTPDLQSISLQKPDDVALWSVPIRKDGPRLYRHRITYFPAQGDPVERDWEIAETELIVVPRYQIPKVGADFNPSLQNFELTPAIEVNLSYDDPQSGARERMTLVFTKNERQAWFLPVPDDAPRAYEMTVTWYYADGRDHTSTPVKLEKPAVILPRAPKLTAPAVA